MIINLNIKGLYIYTKIFKKYYPIIL